MAYFCQSPLILWVKKGSSVRLKIIHVVNVIR